MSFAVFRKYQKPFMWGAVVFSVLVFATFSGFEDLRALLSRDNLGVPYGQFVLETNGKTVDVGEDEYRLASLRLNRLAGRSRNDVSENAVWQFIILREEARAAGIDVSEKDVADVISANVSQMTGGAPVTRESYTAVWRDFLGFSSARDMESFFAEFMLGQRYASFRAQEAGLVTADEVFLQWRQDNERFDYDAVIIPDQAPESVPEPSAEELQKMWDGLPEPLRAVQYRDPRRVDIAYAWATLAPGENGVADDKLAALPEPGADEVQAHFEQVRSERFAEATELTDEIRAALTRELKVIALASKAHADFEAGADKGAEAFVAAMEAAGLHVADPVGLLDDTELGALPGIGESSVSAEVIGVAVGETVFSDPRDGFDQNETHVLLIQGEQEPRPFSFEEAHDQLVKNWRSQRKDQPAKDWREALSKAARERPECQEVIKPLLEAATKRADDEAAALTDATDEARAAKRKEVLDLAEAMEIKPRVAEFEHLVWAEVPRPEGAREAKFTGVAKSYARNPDKDESVTSIERTIKISPLVYRLGVNAVSPVIRGGAAAESAIVIVRARSFPEQGVMAADTTGIDRARTTLSSQRRFEYQQSHFAPDAIVANHQLKVTKVDRKPKGAETEVPPDA